MADETKNQVPSLDEIIARRTAAYVQTKPVPMPEWGCDVEVGNISALETLLLGQMGALEKSIEILTRGMVNPTCTEAQARALLGVESEEVALRLIMAISRFNNIDVPIEEIARPFPVQSANGRGGLVEVEPVYDSPATGGE